MRFSYSSFQAQIRRTNSSRPMSWRVLFSSRRRRVSTTACVAIPAWSVPGIQRASYPCIRRQRIRMSCKVLLSACPRWSAPVTLGGGMQMVYGGLPLLGSAWKYPRSSHIGYHRSCAACGSYCLGSSAMLMRDP